MCASQDNSSSSSVAQRHQNVGQPWRKRTHRWRFDCRSALGNNTGKEVSEVGLNCDEVTRKASGDLTGTLLL